MVNIMENPENKNIQKYKRVDLEKTSPLRDVEDIYRAIDQYNFSKVACTRCISNY